MVNESENARTCPECGATLAKRDDEKSSQFRLRRFCGNSCAAIHRHRKHKAERAASGVTEAERDAARFWPRVDKSGGPDACWPWTGYCQWPGYGKFSRMGRPRFAHRTAMELSGVALEPGDHVCHRCDNPPCCNPAHLFIGTNSDNVADCIAKGRQSKGDGRWNAVLTDDAVREMRRRFDAGESQASLARAFGTSQPTVSVVVRRKTWRHVV